MLVVLVDRVHVDIGVAQQDLGNREVARLCCRVQRCGLSAGCKPHGVRAFVQQQLRELTTMFPGVRAVSQHVQGRPPYRLVLRRVGRQGVQLICL